MRLSTRILLLIVVCLAPVVAVQIYALIDLRKERLEQLSQLAQREAELASGDVTSIVEAARELAMTAEQLPDVRALNTACSDRLTNLLGRLTDFRFIAVFDASGDAVCASTKALLTDHARRPDWIGDVETDDFAVGRLATFGGIDGPFLPVGVIMPASTEPGATQHWIVVAIDQRWLTNHLQRTHFVHSPRLSHSTLMITDRDGTLLARQSDIDEGSEQPPPAATKSLATQDAPGVASVPGHDGRQQLAAYIPAKQSSDSLATIVDFDLPDMMADIYRAAWREAALIAGAALLALVLAWLVGRHFISRPTKALLAAAQHWRNGELSTRADVRGMRSEFGALAAAFNAMAANLQARELERRLGAELLESQVAERTRALSETNNRLQVEIAEREKTEAALHQAQKLQAVGQLAGGIAHDFNNMLATILGNLELMERRLPTGGQPWVSSDTERLRALIERATGAVERGSKLTSRLLAFSRRQRLSARPTDLNKLVADLVTLATSTLGRRVRVVTKLAPDLDPVMADPSQVEAAMLNLCLNARDAMPDGGQLTITTANDMVSARRSPDDPELGHYVRVTIADTGVGMTEDVLRHAFEPFFTTKGPSGSGLGLSQVYGVARQSGGTVRITSAPGEGTEVTLLLPRAAVSAEEDAKLHGADQPDRAGPPDLVLVVDDDSAVREVTLEMLKDLGYAVLEAPGGAEALALLDGPACRADIALLDYAMPGMNGLQLARAIRNRQADIPIVLATGYAELSDTADTDLLDGLLRKPFSIRELHAALVRVRGTMRGSNVVPLRLPKRG